jgi:hypothetical protein
MRQMIIFMAIILLLLAGCAQKTPDIVCDSPYIRHAASCCIDRNANNVCDDDEEEKPLFVEPDYAEEVPDVTANPEQAQPESQETELEEPIYEVTSPTGEKTTATYIGEKDTVNTVPTKYDAAVPKLQDWKVENSHMSMEVTKIIIDVNDIEKTDLRSPDKEAYLKEIYLVIKNKDYNYLNPEFFFKLGDSKDPLVLVKTMHCDRFDPILMEGCENALPEIETMQVRMDINERIPRISLDYTLKLTLQNRRDEDDKNILEIEKTFNMLDLYGATYI